MEGGGKGKGKGKDEGKGKGKGENCCGNSNLNFHPKFLPPPPNRLLYTLYFFEFYNSGVLDLARFEDHTFAYFSGKVLDVQFARLQM